MAAAWRRWAPDVLAAVVRHHGDFDRAEDAVQEALLAASRQWPTDGVPHDPKAWLIRVASRRYVDAWRADTARERRELSDAARTPADALVTRPADEPHAVGGGDTGALDTLTLLLLCCHPTLPPASQVALTLRAVAGLTTAQVARGLLVPEATVAQRISRAKARLRDQGARFVLPPADDLPDRVSAVTHVIHLVYTEGHTSTVAGALDDVSLAVEAVRLARELHRLVPHDTEVTGLLALLLLTHARRAARTTPDGSLVPLAEQDRARWDAALVAEGVALVEAALPVGPVGPLQLQAAIAAVHDEAPTADATDWAQIEVLYGMLDDVAPGPAVTLNRAVAVGEVHGPAAALAVVEPLRADRGMLRHHRLHAVRAHLLERLGQDDEARAEYDVAADLATSLPEQRYLRARAAALGGGPVV
ncbi:RNA polymerase sigma factor [Luteimicrobium subarcticum]|uniref:RNA polymerase ECF family sigma subunit n=1 Tax=Luteimicrobium subarcticum TaxID=620910 RepID=A0A2M8W760_9MICO|nr:sigma-70 family RNA polymerase sigma factor [Luteimicrobium subarcticum]PJI86761.1 RNA polymerase ECF family sigma subunit [Luteimicrobium subarcticum]